jgi:RNA polymerase sigma-70 factor, ECF subfamily
MRPTTRSERPDATEGDPSPPEEFDATVDASDRLASAAAADFQFIWRCLRRFGIQPDAAVDDAVQEVFEVAARKRDRIPLGHERGFLFNTAVFVAAEWRRASRRSPSPIDDLEFQLTHPGADPEVALGAERERLLLDAVLDGLSFELRTVFVLFEIEELTMIEIAKVLELSPGTVASRLRRAREHFKSGARRLRRQLETKRGQP